MARPVVLLAVLMLVTACAAEVAAGPLGVGVIVGEPTGLSLKQWIGQGRAVDLAAAWSFVDDAALHVHMDYLFHAPRPPEIDVPGLLFYFGIGGRIKLVDDEGDEESDNRLGVRVPLGLDYLFAQSHLEMFLEVAPLLDLAPETEFTVNGGLGIRYYFGGRPAVKRT
jgi:hypothetical protein